MATRYEIRTFGDTVRAVIEHLKIQASDTESINRIKRNINFIYLNEVVPASNSWSWLNNTVSVTCEPYFDGGTASVQQNLTRVELTQVPATKMEGRFFSVDGASELYRVASHIVGNNFFFIDSPYNGATNPQAKYKLWTDEVVLPSDCMKVKEVITTNAIKPLDPVSLQQFRKHEISGGALIGSPSFYCEGPLKQASPYADIPMLPAIVSTHSDGLNKSITFAANLMNFLSVGDRIHVSSPLQYTYTGDFLVNNINGNTLSFTGKLAFDEPANVVVTGLTVQKLNTQNTDPAPTLLVYPSIQQRNQRINLVIDYQMFPSELIADRDEPLIPREHRQVLFLGAIWLSADRETDLDRSDRHKMLMDAAIQKMLNRSTSTPKLPTMRVSDSYLRSKGGMFGRGRFNTGTLSEGFGGSTGAGNAPTATGTPNSVAVFDANGFLIGSSDIDLDLLEYLIGTQATGSVVALDSVTTQIDDWDAMKYKSADVQYVIVRGSSYRAGHFMISTDGSVVRFSDSGPMSVGDTGVEWTGDIFAGNLRIAVTLDSQGTSATVYYKVSLV